MAGREDRRDGQPGPPAGGQGGVLTGEWFLGVFEDHGAAIGQCDAFDPGQCQMRIGTRSAGVARCAMSHSRRVRSSMSCPAQSPVMAVQPGR